MLSLTCASTEEELSNDDKEPRFKLDEAIMSQVKGTMRCDHITCLRRYQDHGVVGQAVREVTWQESKVIAVTRKLRPKFTRTKAQSEGCHVK